MIPNYSTHTKEEVIADNHLRTAAREMILKYMLDVNPNTSIDTIIVDCKSMPSVERFIDSAVTSLHTKMLQIAVRDMISDAIRAYINRKS